MDIVEAGAPLCDFLTLCYHANRSPLLWGAHGVGKSACIEETAAKLNLKTVVRDLSLMEPPDLIGLPREREGRTVYLPPSFLPRRGRGVFVLEELNRAPPEMRAPCLELLTRRRLNDYKLPSGWLPVAAANSDDSDYHVQELDPALTSRFVQARVVPHQKHWLKWARTTDVHPRVIEYVESDPAIFDDPISNPRSWTYVSELMKASEKADTSPLVLRATVLGQVGDTRGAAFLRLCNDDDFPLVALEVIENYRNQQSSVLKWIKEGRLDLVRSSLSAVESFLRIETNYEKARDNRTQWCSLSRFLYDLPGDLQEEARRFFRKHAYIFPPKFKKPPLKKRK